MMRKAFTLIEIMIVVAIIALLAAVAIPSLLRARISAQEAAATAAMHTISAAQVQYRATHSRYATLSGLNNDSPPYLDSSLATGFKHGYNFSVSGVTSSQYYAVAEPAPNYGHAFYIDEDGVLCISNSTNFTNVTSHVGPGCPPGYQQKE